MKTAKKYKILKLGMRTIKTAICVLICLLFNHLFSPEVSLISAIAAIVCMQSTIENTLKVGVNRLIGTTIGGGFGILFLPLAQNAPFELFPLLLMSIGIIVTIYLCNVIKMPGSSVICAIVFISLLAIPSDTQNLYLVAVFRIIDTAIGIVVATLVNRFIAQPKLYESRKVHLKCDTFADVYERVYPRFSGSEQMILYDTKLTSDITPTGGSPHPEVAGFSSVRIPVPTEYAKNHLIEAAHIAADYTVTPIYLEQIDGYVEIPYETFPSTVVWQSQEEPSSFVDLLR